MKLHALFLGISLTALASTASAFCGFYVAKADAKLFNKTSQVILVRDGDKTTVTMSNDFQGDVKDFAMVVPVPTILQRDDIRVVRSSLFTKLDEYSGPRLVEYYDQNPCQQYTYELYDMATPTLENVVTADFAIQATSAKSLGVTIEAKYEVEEYDILILSAKKSAGLKTWLTQNGYKIPEQAEEVLEPYIKNNMKFFVVKVNVDKLDEMNGTKNLNKYIDVPEMANARQLRPLQITYNSPKFMLPIRLGMANAKGAQDMIVYALTKKGRVECTNYRTTKIPTNKNVPLFIREKFGNFYIDLFEKAHQQENKEAMFLEYAWNISPQFSGVKCDPCVGPPPIYSDLVDAGVDWAVQGNRATESVFFTRLHVRYTRETHPQDLQFHVTPNQEHFQARYILTNPATGDLSCDEGQRYCANLVKNRANELEELHNLTAWNTQQYKGYVTEYYDQLKDKRLLYQNNEERKNSFVPVLPQDHHDPMFGLKVASLAFVAASMLLFLFNRQRKAGLAGQQST